MRLPRPASTLDRCAAVERPTDTRAFVAPQPLHSIRVAVTLSPGKTDRVYQSGCTCGWRGDVRTGRHARHLCIKQFAGHIAEVMARKVAA